MRYGCAALLWVISSVVTASAQDLPRTIATSTAPAGTRVTPDIVVARLMTFDRNGDGKVVTAELSERMQFIVARGDTSADGALDDSEIRALTLRPLEFVATATRNLQFYGFGDTVGLSSRSHIINTIEDLRLAPDANKEAKRRAASFVDQLEDAARTKLRTAMAPMLTEDQLAELERNVKARGLGERVSLASGNGTVTQALFVSAPRAFLAQYALTADQIKTAVVAIETFRADQRLDEASRSALATELKGVLTDEESDNFRAALARRPVVGSPTGIMGGVVGGFTAVTLKR